MTNLQLLKIRIEKSTSKELANLLGLVHNCFYCFCKDKNITTCNEMCSEKTREWLEINETQLRKNIANMNAQDIIKNFPHLACDFCNCSDNYDCSFYSPFEKCQIEQFKFLQQDCSKNFMEGIKSYVYYKLKTDENMNENDEDFYYKLFDLLDNYDWMQDKIQQFHFLNEGYAEGE